MEGSQIWFYSSIIFLDPGLDPSLKPVLKKQMPFSQANLFLKVMWADLPISYCVYSQAVTWNNKGASCVSLHSVSAQWEGQRGIPQTQHDKSQFGHLENDPFHLTLLVCPHWLWPMSSFFLLSDLLHKGTHIWQQSALAETPSHWHYVKSKGCRSIFFLYVQTLQVRPPINQMQIICLL